MASPAVLLRGKMISYAVIPQLRSEMFVARIHSMHCRAANLLSKGELITIALPEVGALPNGMVVEAQHGFPCLELAPGMSVVGDGGALVFHQAGVVVDLSGAVPWSPRLPRIAPMVCLDSVAANWHLAVQISVAGAPPEGFGPLLSLLEPAGICDPSGPLPRLAELAHRRIRSIVSELEAGECTRAVAASQLLVGLGVGLTPSGDDFLVGLSAALEAVGHSAAPAFAAGCARLAKGRTSIVAETFLACAGRGEFSGRIQALLDALLNRSPSVVASHVRRSMNWGATSGADCMLGLLLGLAIATNWFRKAAA